MQALTENIDHKNGIPFTLKSNVKRPAKYHNPVNNIGASQNKATINTVSVCTIVVPVFFTTPSIVLRKS